MKSSLPELSPSVLVLQVDSLSDVGDLANHLLIPHVDHFSRVLVDQIVLSFLWSQETQGPLIQNHVVEGVKDGLLGSVSLHSVDLHFLAV